MNTTKNWICKAMGTMAVLGAVACDEPVDDRAYLRLRAQITGPSTFAIELDVLFPEGRAPGAPVLATRPGFERAIGEVDAAGRAVVPLLCPGCEVVIERGAPCASLETPGAEGGVRVGSDIVASVADGLPLCVVEGEAPRALTVHGPIEAGEPGRIEYLVVDGSSVYPASLAGAVLMHEGEAIPLRYVGDWFGGALELATAVEPTGAFTLALPAATNALGEPAELSFVPPLATSATIGDLDFVEAPPAGAIATFGYELVHEDGALVLRDEGMGPRRSSFAALIALGDPGEASVVRWAAQHGARSGAYTEAGLYREGGGRSETVSMYGHDALAIPEGQGALWLVLTNTQTLYAPNDRADPEVLVLDAITLE